MIRRLLFILLLLTGAALAQQGNTVIIRFAGAPTGSCSPVAVAVNNATGDFYDCLAGAWHLVAGGGGGTGTVTSVGLTVNGTSPSGIFTVTGSPVTIAGTLNFNLAGTSGGIPYFSGSTVLSSSGALTLHALTIGGGAGGAPTPLASLGSATTLLHGAAAGDPTYSAVVSADLNLTTTTCTNQFLTAIGATGTGTCTTATLASAQFANQGTTTTVLHGNGAGNPSFAAVSLATDVTGQLPIAAVGSAGLSATSPVTIASTGVIACATCATTTNGGALSGTSPIAVSAAGAISINTNGITATQLATQYSKWLACDGKGLGDGLNAIPAGTYLQSTCRNITGVTVTITGVQCFTDNNGTSTLNAAGNTLGALLTGAVTCTNSYAAGTQSANVALTSNDYIKFTWVADGTSKQTDWIVTGTY